MYCASASCPEPILRIRGAGGVVSCGKLRVDFTNGGGFPFMRASSPILRKQRAGPESCHARLLCRHYVWRTELGAVGIGGSDVSEAFTLAMREQSGLSDRPGGSIGGLLCIGVGHISPQFFRGRNSTELMPRMYWFHW